MSSNVGHGIFIDNSAHPSPAKRGNVCTYQVAITNGTTKQDWEVQLENHIMGSALEFDGCNPAHTWPTHIVTVSRGATVPDPHLLKVPTGSAATDEYIHCVSVECRDPVLQGPWQLCTQNMPVILGVKIT
jgi:hypothetical protein